MKERDLMTYDRPGTDTPQAAPLPELRRGWKAGGARFSRRAWSWILAVTVATAGAGMVVGLLVASSIKTGSGGSSGATGAGSGAGSTAPVAAHGFSIPALGHPGQRVSLSAYAGKPVIVNFFASWCAPCKRETPLLARFYRSGHVDMIGIDVNDQAAQALAFVHKSGVSYPVGVDAGPAMATSIAYNVSGLPQTFFLNARHQIVKRVFGPVTPQELTAGTALMGNRTK